MTADSFLRNQTPVDVQNGPQWTKAADFIVTETLAGAMQSALQEPQRLPPSPKTPTKSSFKFESRHAGLAERRPHTVDGGAGRPPRWLSEADGVSPRRGVGEARVERRRSGGGGAAGGVGSSGKKRGKKPKRPAHGLTGWKESQGDTGTHVAVGAGRTAVYSF